MRERRREAEVPVAALVGYTNAGKTTLLNQLTNAKGIARNQLFTTLDPLARRMRVPALGADSHAKGDGPGENQQNEFAGGETLIITDTVGFLHHLPHHLIEAFKATLEEARDANLLLHVVDASHPLVLEQTKAVEEVLRDLSLQDKPIVTVLNKRDLMDDSQRLIALERGYDIAVAISAKTGEGIDRLLEVIGTKLELLLVHPAHLCFPAERQDLVARVYQAGHVLKRREADGTVELIARIPAKLKALISPYIRA